MTKQLGQKRTVSINWWVGLVISFLVCAFYAALVSFKTMPISEGWYSEYAWLINQGSLPYRDFEYLFFPLYMFIIAGFTSIFGYSILALRILGVIVYGGIGVAVYCIFAKLFDNISALIAAFVATLFLQSQVGVILYDYIQFHDLFALIATYFLVKITIDSYNRVSFTGKIGSAITGIFTWYMVPIIMMVLGAIGYFTTAVAEHPVRGLGFLALLSMGLLVGIANIATKKTSLAAVRASEIPVSAILCGIFAAMECMVKQSNGVLMITMVFLYLLYCAVVMKNRQFLNAFYGAVAGVIFAFSFLLVYLMATDTLEDFKRCCFGSAISAKGGVMKALFAWIWPNFLNTIKRPELSTVLLTIGIGISLYSRRVKAEKKHYNALWMIPIAAAMGILSWKFINDVELASKFNGRNDTYIPGLILFPCMVLFLVYAIYLLWRCVIKKAHDGAWAEFIPVFPVLGAIFAQGYGSGMSGGLATSQTAIAMGLIVALCIHAALRTKAKAMMAWLLTMTILMTGTYIGRKTMQYYDWWGLTQDGLAQHTETVDVPMLEGIHVRPMDKLCYETVYNDVMSNTEEGDSIFVFPHAPVFYTMTDRHSVTYSQVQWFDVSSATSIAHDIEALKKTVPKMIVYVTVPDWVYDGHEGAFGTYQTRQMREFLLNELVPQYGYALLNQVDIGNGFFVSTYLLPQQ